MSKTHFKTTLWNVLLASTLGVPGSLSALDENRLWLPKSYERIYLDLKRSAEAAESLDRCVTVLRGTIDFEQSTKAHPIFRIQCRQANGRTYNEMVNGITYETLTTVEETEDMVAEKLDIQKQAYWQQCNDAFVEKTRLFLDLSVLNEKPEPEEFSLDHALFRILFDAKDMDGNQLKYKAVCSVKKDQGAVIRVRKRYDSQK